MEGRRVERSGALCWSSLYLVAADGTAAAVAASPGIVDAVLPSAGVAIV